MADKNYNVGEAQPQTYQDIDAEGNPRTVEYYKYSFDGCPSTNGNSGSFCIKYPEGYDVNNPDPNVKVVFLSWGAETSDSNSGYLFGKLDDGTIAGAEDCIFITPSSNAPEDIQAIVDNFDVLHLENNYVSAITFSQPSKTPVLSAYVNIMNDNPSGYQPLVVMGPQEGLLSASSMPIQEMLDKKVAIFVVSDGNQALDLPNYVSNLDALNSAGVPVVYIKIENNSDYIHGIVDTQALQDGLATSLAIGTKVDIEELQERYGITITFTDSSGNEVDYEQYLNQNHLLRTKKSELVSQYERLENIEKIPYISVQNRMFSNSLIQVDKLLLNSSINNIRGEIRDASNFSSFKMPMFSSLGIFSEIASCMENYFVTVGELYTKLEKETLATLSVESALTAQDEYLSGKAEEIEEPNEVITSTNQSNPGVNPAQDGNVINDIGQAQDGNVINDIGQAQDGNVINDINPSQGADSTQEPGSNPEVDTAPSQIIDDPIEGKVIYNYKDGHKLLIEYDADKVKSMKYQYNYSTVEEANTNLPVIQTKYADQEFVNNIEVKDNNVEVIFKDIAFNTTSLEQIKGIYFIDNE